MSVTKTVLGWVINTVEQTIELPEHRKEQLLSFFINLRQQTSVPFKKWHQILGELQSVVIGISGSRGLFSMLQLALQKVDSNDHIRLAAPVKDQLDDFQHLAEDQTARPTAMAKL